MELIINNIPLLLSLLAGAIAAVWSYFTNKKNKELSLAIEQLSVKLKEADVDSSKIRVANENFEFYQNMLDDAHSRYQTLMVQYEKETFKLNTLLEETRKMVDTHEKYIAKQRVYIQELENILVRNNIKLKGNEKE